MPLYKDIIIADVDPITAAPAGWVRTEETLWLNSATGRWQKRVGDEWVPIIIPLEITMDEELAAALADIEGIKGDKGDPGEPGVDGQQGIQGIQGEIGGTGAPGANGQQGIQGVPGEAGAQGQQGIQGVAGQDGAPGAKGDTGDTGQQGIQGIQGIQGDVGPQGPAGAPGTTVANVRLTADRDNSTTSFADVTDLVFALEANKFYAFKFLAVFQTAATGTGIGFGVTIPTGATVVLQTHIPTTLIATTHGAAIIADSGTASASVVTANANLLAIVEGVIFTTNAGNLQLRFKSEVATSNAKIKAGSVGLLYTVA